MSTSTPSFASIVLFACCLAPSTAGQPATGAMTDNPLLTESTLPLRYPRFDLIRNEHFAPAFERGMAEHLKQIESIAKDQAKPTFENTIVAMERAA